MDVAKFDNSNPAQGCHPPHEFDDIKETDHHNRHRSGLDLSTGEGRTGLSFSMAFFLFFSFFFAFFHNEKRCICFYQV
jgi:hypothetical protein